MERELMVTGVGGQGVQLAAQVIARAATLENRHVMLFGVYAGAMRGMNTDAAVVVGDTPITTPPVLPATWSAILMHDKFASGALAKLRPNAVVLRNDSVCEGVIDREAFQVVDLGATEIAIGLGSEMVASMVMTGAYTALTGLVTLECVIEAMGQSIPSYRRQHIAANEVAIRKGFESVEQLAAPAWELSKVNQ